MRRLALLAAGCLAAAVSSATAQQPALERVYVAMHFYQFEDGGFWWKSRGELLGINAAADLTRICQYYAYDCTETADEMLAVAEGVTETAQPGLDVRGFIASPPGYQICRAFSGPERWTLYAPTSGQLVREQMRNGIAYTVAVPPGARLTDQFIDFQAVFEYVPADADLAEAGCWPAYELAWSCGTDGCSFYTQQAILSVAEFVQATGVTATGPASVQWGVPVIESGADGGTVVYEFEVIAPGSYRLEFDYAATEERPVTITLNGLPVTNLAMRFPNQSTLDPRPLLDPDPFAQDLLRQWWREGPVYIRHGMNRLELTSTGPFPLILQMRLRPP